MRDEWGIMNLLVTLRPEAVKEHTNTPFFAELTDTARSRWKIEQVTSLLAGVEMWIGYCGI
ncbi:hypothetical protein [Thioflexithrix psekupsensis]|uniref:hypothetical protein n=1 Tax=Thioflexithrix psekupsensis TaxID=1570016 RepID=UPI001593C49A|nr:hypothetical protein [Thioflexithrix psekupsensis]